MYPKGDTFGNISITSVPLWFFECWKKKFFMTYRMLKIFFFYSFFILIIYFQNHRGTEVIEILPKVWKKIVIILRTQYFFKNQNIFKIDKVSPFRPKCHLYDTKVTLFLEKCHPLKKHTNWKFDFFSQKVTLLVIFRSPQSPYDFWKNIFKIKKH